MKFKLAFAIHNHQPVGNFAAIFEDAQTHCYRPFLELIKGFPQIKLSLHQSGILWQWQKAYHPEFFELVGGLVDSGQVELLSGGFYEPIMPAIPDRDKIGQLNMLTDYLKKHFETDIRGMWLAERVWEPHLPKIINEGGLHYLPIDDTHFKYAGYDGEKLFGSYVTEEAGRAVTLFPILKRLRYQIPFGEPEEIIEFLRRSHEEYPGAVAAYADDGEKFGIWPGTYRHCYEEGWLHRFFTALIDNSDWLEVISLGQAYERTSPLGRAYLPAASYREMLHWALPADAFADFEDFEKKLEDFDLIEKYGHFVRGGHWRGFLAKYDEANLMHKKMMIVSDLLAELTEQFGRDDRVIEQARDLLYAGQCNCPYWHGVFGGLYLPHLRWANYRKLAKAESILRQLGGRKIFVETTDYDRDGHQDIVIGGENLSMVVSPQYGGRITELISLDKNVNLTDCLSRRKEGYHRKLLEAQKKSKGGATQSIHDRVAAKEEGLEKLIIEDLYLRRPLIDHFLPENTDLHNFMNNRYQDLGDFFSRPYEYKLIENDESYLVELTRRGTVSHQGHGYPLTIGKRIQFPKVGRQLTVHYHLQQNEIGSLPIRLAVEFDFNMLAPDAVDRYVLVDGRKPNKNRHLAALAEHHECIEIAYLDEYQKLAVRIASDRPVTFWRMPIYTVSLSEGGFEKVFQGNCTLLLHNVSLASSQPFEFKINLFAGSPEFLPVSNKTNEISAPKV